MNPSALKIDSRMSEVDFTCPICLDIFVNPVLLPCSHSICSDCIQGFWESKGSNECPICREVSHTDDPPVNRDLRNLCEAFQQDRSQRSSCEAEAETLCSVHREKLKLFCLDDQQPVCLVCRDSKTHFNHRFCPVEEAVNNNKVKLRDSLQHLKEKLGTFENFKLTLEQTADLIKNETQNTEEKINKEFEELNEILLNEKASRTTALREEEEQKSQKIKEKTEQTSKRIVSLTWKIRDIEQLMDAKDDSLLKDFKNTLQRAGRSPPDPGNVSELLIDGMKYLSDLKLTVLQKIQGSSGDLSVRGAHGFRGGPNSRGDNSGRRGKYRGGKSSRGGQQYQGGPEFQGDGSNFGGSYGSRGGQNPRGGQQYQGGPEFQGDGSNFGGSYGSRGGNNHRGGQRSRRGQQYQGGPEFQGDGSNFGGSYGSRGGQNPRGGQQYQGGPELQGDGSNFGGSYGSRGGQSPRGGQQFRGDGNCFEGSYSASYNHMGAPSSRGGGTVPGEARVAEGVLGM